MTPFEIKLEEFRAEIERRKQKRAPWMGYSVEVEPRGTKYAKLVTFDGTQRMVAAFVQRDTGEIFKPASWRAPAKHARGNIFSEHNGAEALSEDGHVLYLK